MKLVTTFAALELLGRDYRWKTEAYLGGPLDGGVLRGDLILKGYGDPKITIEQWQSFMAALRAKGLDRVAGDLALDRTWFKPAKHDPAEFDKEPLKPYNVGPDALLVNFKSVRFVFAPNAAGDAVDVRAEPPLAEVALGAPPRIGSRRLRRLARRARRDVRQPGRHGLRGLRGKLRASCGERDWYVALLDHPAFRLRHVRHVFPRRRRAVQWRACSDGTRPRGVAPFATLESPPLYDIVRDVNKLSNNVMARQIFLTLATTRHPPPATPALAADVVQRFLRERKIAMPGLVIENGSGLSRNERVTAGGLAQLLAAADRSSAREEFASSLAVAATDGTVQRRFQNGTVAGQALLKTGTLEGVRALAGYVIDAQGRRWIVVGHHQPSQRRAGPAARWTSSCNGSIAAPDMGPQDRSARSRLGIHSRRRAAPRRELRPHWGQRTK